MKTSKNILLVLSTGYIFVYFSEHLFWARVRPDDSFGNWLATWIAYSLMAFVFLNLVSYFRIKNIWSLFLAAAVFGWLAEGLIVQTTYESLPLSISFTGLAWHATITVWIGWYAMRKSFISTDPLSTLKLASVIGLCYGLWAISWWLEPDGGVSSIPEFALFSLAITLLFIFACWLADWSSTEIFAPSRWVIISIHGLFVLYFLFITIPSAPVAIVILPVLFGVSYLGLRKNRLNTNNGSFLDDLKGPVSFWKYLSLLALPVTAILIYALAMSLNLQLNTNWILYLIATPLGFIFFGISLYKMWRISANL